MPHLPVPAAKLCAALSLCFAVALPAVAQINLSPAQVKQVSTHRQQFNALRTEAQTVANYRQALKLADTLTKALEKPMEERLKQAKMPMQEELEALSKTMPGLWPALVAEGTMLVIYPDYAAYAKAAQRTTGKGDDAFFALMQKAYGETYTDYGQWMQQTWDYGGCSWLGKGIHIQLLQGIAQLRKAKNPLVPELQVLETDLLQDLQQSQQFCLPQAQAIQEMQKVIPLAPAAARPQLNQRLQQLKKPTPEMGFDCNREGASCAYG
jgi:hypothetical protein